MSDILKMAAEMAADLHSVGAMEKKTLRKIEELNVPKVPKFNAERIVRIREKNRLSQPVMAAYLNVGKSTVAQWEQGKKTPNGPSARLLDMLERSGLAVFG